MFLSYLELRNFRNIRNLRLNLTKGITVLWGDNGEGKTNLVESVYVLSYARPLRKSGGRHLVMKGEEETSVRGIVKDGRGEVTLAIQVKKSGGITPFKAGKRANSFQEFAGGLKSVAFIPEDIQHIFATPHGRRRLVDQTAAMVKPFHVKILLEFMRCLRQRNKLLRLEREGKSRGGILDHFDEEFMRLSESMAERRCECLEKFREPMGRYFREIEGGGEVNLEGDMSFNRELFHSKQKRDLEQGRTEYGPHRADFKVLVKGKDGRHYASQGIRRIVAISFRLAQAELVGASTGQRPLLLLDDITSEIDPGRRRNLLKLVEQLKYQTILTTTERKLIEDGFEGDIRALEIQKGSVL